eukprot:CAMPEP_0173113842 /NCGR_PEP_ID=MMETSP1102-20130122/47176_1 /TAXON_ID=49646 /ORGANISM="Geminigera sp., Strain Caron Lab Isolate" /LENGTH=71 /DNA_ID=CAMNT_0014015825 /DNA_START=352 /DNA_END=567 /DNA_ORIENTATION=-
MSSSQRPSGSSHTQRPWETLHARSVFKSEALKIKRTEYHALSRLANNFLFRICEHTLRRAVAMGWWFGGDV